MTDQANGSGALGRAPRTQLPPTPARVVAETFLSALTTDRPDFNWERDR